MFASLSVSERLWRTDYELCPIPLSILLLVTVGTKLIGVQDGLEVGRWAVDDLLLPNIESPTLTLDSYAPIPTPDSYSTLSFF